MKSTIMAVLCFVFCTVAHASDLEDLARAGYAVVDETRVDGEFEGCDFDKPIPLMNGLVFECVGYRYSYAYSPEVLILKNIRSGDIKLIINEEEYTGRLYRR